MIGIKGQIIVPDQALDLVITKLLPEHLKLTREEKGCVFFEVIQDSQNKNIFIVKEIFENNDAYESHQERTKNSKWFQYTKDFKRDYKFIEDSL